MHTKKAIYNRQYRANSMASNLTRSQNLIIFNQKQCLIWWGEAGDCPKNFFALEKVHFTLKKMFVWKGFSLFWNKMLIFSCGYTSRLWHEPNYFSIFSVLMWSVTTSFFFVFRFVMKDQLSNLLFKCIRTNHFPPKRL